VKAKLGELIGAYQVLNSWGDVKMGPRLGFMVIRASKSLEQTIASYNDRRMALLNEYGTPPADQIGAYKFKTPGDRAKFDEEMAKLLTLEVEIELQKIPASLLDDEVQRGNFAPTVAQLATILCVIEE
jgi:hypothetical protein